MKKSGDVSGMRNAGDVVSNDIVSGGNVCDLKAHPVAQEKGTVDAAEGVTTQRVFASFPNHASLVVLLDSIQTMG